MRLPLTLPKYSSKTLTTGFALFAMFFGAGNMVFPLYLGANAGGYLVLTAFCFLFVGVGTPFLGLFATSLYQGDYWSFFNRLGKLPALVVITFLIFIIGPLFAGPRTETITFQALLPFLPSLLKNHIVFSLLYCALVFVMSYRDFHVLNIIGHKITPVKLSCFTLLILLSVLHPQASPTQPQALTHQMFNAISMGYGTMDMLGAFFFCSIASRSIQTESERLGIHNDNFVKLQLLKSCCIGGILLSLVYLGFMFAAAAHNNLLANKSPDKLIAILAMGVLNNYGALFIGVAVTFACFATAIALADVSSEFFHSTLFRNKVNKKICLLLVVFIMFLMTQLGFSQIMHVASPILHILYPALIVLCIVNILYKLYGFKYIKLPFTLALGISLAIYLW